MATGIHHRTTASTRPAISAARAATAVTSAIARMTPRLLTTYQHAVTRASNPASARITAPIRNTTCRPISRSAPASAARATAALSRSDSDGRWSAVTGATTLRSPA